jgi:hypothetical protein
MNCGSERPQRVSILSAFEIACCSLELAEGYSEVYYVGAACGKLSRPNKVS